MSWLGNIAARLKAGGTVSKSGGVAKERLSIILAHQRGDELLQTIDLEGLQQEILQLMKVQHTFHASQLSSHGCTPGTRLFIGQESPS